MTSFLDIFFWQHLSFIFDQLHTLIRIEEYRYTVPLILLITEIQMYKCYIIFVVLVACVNDTVSTEVCV